MAVYANSMRDHEDTVPVESEHLGYLAAFDVWLRAADGVEERVGEVLRKRHLARFHGKGTGNRSHSKRMPVSLERLLFS
jgi:hypothetical protein